MNQYELNISSEEAQVMRGKIKKMGLKTPEWFNHLSDNELIVCYNGAGGGYMPEALCKVLTRLRKFAPEAVLIHNVEFQYTRRFQPIDYDSRKKFHTANHRLRENVECLAKTSKPWYSPRRYWWILIAWHAWYVYNESGYEEWIW
jgi:hypothetical protein